MMLKQWKMDSPNLVISITGGTLEMNAQLRDVFRHGLVKAAESTGILLFSQ